MGPQNLISGLLGGAVPGVPGVLARGAITAIGRAMQQRVPPPPPERRPIYRTAGYRVVAWMERGFGTVPRLYVAVERNGYYGLTVLAKADPPPSENWQQVKIWTDVQVTPAPFWKPWRRKYELGAVVERAIAFVESVENAEAVAAATLEAVAEAQSLT